MGSRDAWGKPLPIEGEDKEPFELSAIAFTSVGRGFYLHWTNSGLQGALTNHRCHKSKICK